jgi:hypothetical protein
LSRYIITDPNSIDKVTNKKKRNIDWQDGTLYAKGSRWDVNSEYRHTKQMFAQQMVVKTDKQRRLMVGHT